MQELEMKLSQIYNTLALIPTTGDGTIKMAACLDALNQCIGTLQQIAQAPAPEVAMEEVAE